LTRGLGKSSVIETNRLEVERRSHMVKRIAVILCFGLLLGATVLAQGTSPVKVTGISVSPTTFKAGDTVTVTVKLHNTATKPYDCVGGGHFAVSVYVFKASPYTVANQVWSASQPLTTPLGAGENRTVTLSTKWTVPNIDTSTFHFMAWSPVCAPDEFGQTATLKVNRECVYRYHALFEFKRVPLKSLQAMPK
jgi:hypothetical protein